ncbi:hypothetical protein ACFWJT_05755 [Streptomyces sp. NPDC127069]
MADAANSGARRCHSGRPWPVHFENRAYGVHSAVTLAAMPGRF